MFEKLMKASPIELEVWMWGAGILGFGAGALIGGGLHEYAYLVVAVGAVLHGWAMYRIYFR